MQKSLECDIIGISHIKALSIWKGDIYVRNVKPQTLPI